MQNYNFSFPRYYPMRSTGGGGYFGFNGNAANAFGDIISGVIGDYQQRQDQRRRDELANVLMNNGQIPGADPYVRRAVYPDGDQGDDPGAIPFASTNTPHTGGTQEMGLLQALQANQQKSAAMQALQDYRDRQQALRERALDLEEKGINSRGGGGRRGAAAGPTMDSYDALSKALSGAFPTYKKDEQPSLADFSKASWNYPGGDPSVTTLRWQSGDELNPDYQAEKPASGIWPFNSPAQPATGTPRRPVMSSIDIPTGQATSLLGRLQALNAGNPQAIARKGETGLLSTAQPGANPSPVNAQIQAARNWLDDPKNATDPRRDAISAKLRELQNQ